MCFTAKDGKMPAEELLLYLEKYELPVYYDSERFAAEADYNLKSYKKGIEKSKYAIILLTSNSVSSPCVQEEIQQIFERYKDNHIKPFPVFCGVSPESLPPELQWLAEIMYYELNSDIALYCICNHITECILADELGKYRFQAIQQFILHSKGIPLMSYPVKLLNAYSLVDDQNHNVRVSLIYALHTYIKNSYDINAIPKYYYAGIIKFFDVARLCISMEPQEMNILERMILLVLNAVLFGHQA